MTMDLTGLVRAVRAINPEAYGPATIGALLRENRIDDPIVATLPVRERGYTRNLIYSCDDFEVLVLRWSAEAVSAIHDHADQQCWFSAIRGSFDLTNYRRRMGGWRPGYARIEVTETVSGISIGEPDYRYGDFDIHRVSVDPDGPEAISVHVYARPVTTCLVYDEARAECIEKRLAYDTVIAERLWLASA
jgi:hypothetical protein